MKFGDRSKDQALFIILVYISYHPINHSEPRRYRYNLLKLALALVDELIIMIVILIFNLLFSLSYIFVVIKFLVIDIACWDISAGSTCKSSDIGDGELNASILVKTTIKALTRSKIE